MLRPLAEAERSVKMVGPTVEEIPVTTEVTKNCFCLVSVIEKMTMKTRTFACVHYWLKETAHVQRPSKTNDSNKKCGRSFSGRDFQLNCSLLR